MNTLQQTVTDGESAAGFRFHDETFMHDLDRKLVERGLLTREQLNEAGNISLLSGQALDRVLKQEQLVAENDLLSLLAELSGIPLRSISEFDIEPETTSLLPPRLVLRYRCMPVRMRGNTLLIAVNHVPFQAMVDGLRLLLDCELDWMLCAEAEISGAVKHFYGLGVKAIETLIHSREVSRDDVLIDETDLSSLETTDPGVLLFVKQVIAEAINTNATDIHIEPYEKKIRLRYRIDGVLQEIPIPRGIQRLQRALASCVKIMAQLNIAERRKPHDGRIKVRLGGDELDLRVSVLPTRFGETVNMRILNRKSMLIDLEQLGLTGEQQRMLQYLGGIPHGISLVTGPTGSGKTTTLYALLSRMNTKSVKIITVEDPVEYQIEGINQIQVNPSIGLTFANILRSLLRHDPDIILVGEIRDAETAQIAVRASLTGHLVFSTLHANDATGSIVRLVNMGIEPYLVATCLEGAAAQRLVRRLCTVCRKEAPAFAETTLEAGQLWPELAQAAEYYTAHGCAHCNFTGYSGRIALFEIMIMNDRLRGMIVRNKTGNDIRREAIETGLTTLRKSGFRLVMQGVTSVEEVLRVTSRFPSHDPLA